MLASLRAHRKAVYIVSFILVCFLCAWITQFSVYPDHRTGAREATAFVFGAWFGHPSTGSAGVIVLAGLVIIALLYLFFIALINYFWIASALVVELSGTFSAINFLKIQARNEAFQPADLIAVTTGNTGEIVSFVPVEGHYVVYCYIGLTALTLASGIVFTVLDRPHRCLDWASWRAWVARVLIFALTAGSIGYSVSNLANTETVVGRLTDLIGDNPRLWDPVSDYRANGAITGFARYINPKVMDAPAGYSGADMADIADRYFEAAEEINQTRTGDITDQSVIMILCESCKPPSMTPNLEVEPNPTPFLEAIGQTTSSGRMLSTSLGGGTANIEYQSLTGLSMGLFSPMMTTPFQQLVPISSYLPNATNWWPKSQAVHVYQPNMYSRDIDYQKFGVDHFWSLREPDVVSCTDKLPDSPYISDACAYQSALDALSVYPDENQFISLITMQNHGAYTYSYPDGGDFDISGQALGDGKNDRQIETFVQGMNYTDQATEDFLAKLDELDRPVTVVWYGDHSPSIYDSDLNSRSDRLKTYETQYFIYSNKAARGHDAILENAGYSSSNFFMAQVAEQTSSRVSPFLALLTELHDEFPAMGVAVAARTDGEVTSEEEQRSSGDLLLLDADGQPVDQTTLTPRQRRLLDDYRMVQYDITAGQHHLADKGFMDFPA